MLKVLSYVRDKNTARAEIFVDSTAALATSVQINNETLTLTTGSIAWDVSTGDFYGLVNTTWHKQDGSGDTP